MTPAILANAGPLLERYDAVFCDVWGVMHNGKHAHSDAGDALARFRRAGGTVILVSNAPVPAEGVVRVLERTGVSPDAWDAIVSSGDIALAHIADKGYRALHRIGPARRDSMLFKRLPGASVPLDRADAIVCTGLADEINETVASYHPLIEEGIAHRLPFVCANPDLVVDVGDRRFLCAGSIAAAYEHRGGAVFWAGTPHPSAYAAAFEKAAALRGARPQPARVLAIGDAVRTDLAAAQGAGIDAIFIASGIHNDEVLSAGEIDPNKLAALFAPSGTPCAVGAMVQLRW